MPYGAMGSPEQAARPEWTYTASGILNWNQRIEKEENRLVVPIIKARPLATTTKQQQQGWYTERVKTEYPGSIEQDFVSRNFHALQHLLGLSPDKKRPGQATFRSPGSPLRKSAKGSAGSLSARSEKSQHRSPRDRDTQRAKHSHDDLSLRSPHRFLTPGSTLTPRLRTGDIALESAIDLGEYWPFESRIRADLKKEEAGVSPTIAGNVPKLRLESATIHGATRSRANTNPSSSLRSRHSQGSSADGLLRVKELQAQVLQERAKREDAELRLFARMREMAQEERGAHTTRPDLHPVNVDGSGLHDLQVGKKIKDMFRPPTGDLTVTWREGVPSLGIDNSLWHSTVDALGSTHNTPRARRFLPSRQQY